MNRWSVISLICFERSSDVERRAALKRIWADESGATAIEYALICGIMMLAVVSIAATGGAVDAVYGEMSQLIDAIDDAGGGADPEDGAGG